MTSHSNCVGVHLLIDGEGHQQLTEIKSKFTWQDVGMTVGTDKQDCVTRENPTTKLL